MRHILSLLILLITLLNLSSCKKDTYHFDDNSIVIVNGDSIKLRLTAYGDKMIRLQYALSGEVFFADNHYEMVESHDFDGRLNIKSNKTDYEVSIEGESLLKLYIDRETLEVDYKYGDDYLLNKARFSKSKDSLKMSFEQDSTEHFTGLGHSYFGRSESIDLKGKLHKRNYGSEQIEQAPLIVPFYASSKGYGIFLNSTFENYFNFGYENTYEFGVNTHGFDGQIDYFFILGPSIKQVLQEYITLTGKPRLPQKSIFGLQLSDKGHDHNSETPSDEQWWKTKIKTHVEAGFPIDHVVNDNRWRAGGGKRCESFIEWDRGRYPNPELYNQWVKEQGLTMTLDFNRCIGQFSEGWRPEFNIPVTDAIDFKESAPDLTNPEFRTWFWDIFYKKALDPNLDYPGDGLWIDEFDEMGKAPKDMLLANGRSSAEMWNYWFFLIAKALVKEGWDKKIGEEKRPYVWVRGMTAGAQRYATLWSGDIKPNYKDMKAQIRGMQLAGLSGFPFWGHDAGGFYDWDKNVGPNERLYQQWAMGMGIFSPIWKPHGMGDSRWPLDRSLESQEVAKIYSDLRYALIPYTYSNAYLAHHKGIPMVRAMILDYGNEDKAWDYDLQYLWGKQMLIAPTTSKEDLVELWLPKGGWYNFWNEKFHPEEAELSYKVKNHKYPIFVRLGAIIPMVEPASNITSIKDEELTLNVYSGDDGSFILYEDDGKTERYRTKAEYRKTRFSYDNTAKKITIEAAEGTFSGANAFRTYTVILHGVSKDMKAKVNGNPITNVIFDANKNIITIVTGEFSVNEEVIVKLY